MTQSWQERTELLFKNEKTEKIQNSSILIAGLGGVGAYAAEMLCRAGVKNLTIIDFDTVKQSNKNRQLIALESTIGLTKTEVMASRLSDINPDINLNVMNVFLRDELTDEILAKQYDYVVDAIDTLSPKIFFIKRAVKNGLKLVSSMGAGGKTDPEKIMISDISESYNCDLARALRKKLSGLGIKSGFKVVFSSEKTKANSKVYVEDEPNKKTTVGTVSYMPAIFGCYCASVVIREIAGEEIFLEKTNKSKK